LKPQSEQSPQGIPEPTNCIERVYDRIMGETTRVFQTGEEVFVGIFGTYLQNAFFQIDCSIINDGLSKHIELYALTACDRKRTACPF
jgi:hypothetical protein